MARSPAALLLFVWASIGFLPSADAISFRRTENTDVRSHGATGVTPVEKVIVLLEDLSAQVQEEGKEEAASYDKFACFCKEQADGKIAGITKANAKIEELDALITELQGEIAQLGLDAQKARDEVSKERNESAAAVDVRTLEVANFTEEQAELKQAVDLCQRALDRMLESQGQVKDAAFLQRESADVMKAVQQALAKLSSTRSGGAIAAPAPAGAEAAYMPYNGRKYTYSSGVVIDTLRSLTRTFQEQLTALEEGEAQDAHSFNMMEGARANRIKSLQAGISQKEQLIAKKSTEEQEASKILAEETSARDADQAFLDELTTTCEQKASLWDQRSKMRSSELTALTEAVGLLKGSADSYSVNTKLVGLLATKQAAAKPKKAAPSFVQLKRGEVRSAPAVPSWKPQLTKFLQGKAQSLSSATLLSVALSLERASNAEDPEPVDHFVRVRALINDLITRLEAEASAEATSKTFCDTEMANAISTRDAKAVEKESLQASIDETDSAIKQLTSDIAELSEEIAGLKAALLEMTELRAEEKAQHNATESVALEGAETLKQAIELLSEFYGGVSLAQTKQTPYTPYTAPGADREGNTVGDLAPETFSTEYSGKIAESKGIIGLLQVILSDFERTATTTAQAEAEAQKEFEKQSSALNTEINAKETSLDTMETDKETKESALIGFKDSLNDAESMHDAAVKELQTLKASCVDSEESWETRRAQREQEIEALKQALKILQEWKGF